MREQNQPCIQANDLHDNMLTVTKTGVLEKSCVTCFNLNELAFKRLQSKKFQYLFTQKLRIKVLESWDNFQWVFFWP